MRVADWRAQQSAARLIMPAMTLLLAAGPAFSARPLCPALGATGVPLPLAPPLRPLAMSPPLRASRLITLCVPDEPDESFSEDPGAWRVAKAQLVENWSKEVRRRKPRFFGFKHARQWARAMHFETERDWRRWVENGEKRNPYVPSFPDEVYAGRGWVSWDDFLNGPYDA